MALYVFSDAHLGAGTADDYAYRLTKIKALFEKVRADGDRLIILGDLFDYWFEYKTAIPRGHIELIAELHDLRKRNIQIDYVCGNHDFWMLDFFPKELGVPIHRDAFESVYAGKRIHCFHGDGLSRSDTSYRILKQIFRNPLGIALYRLLPVDFATWLASGVSGESRRRSSQLPEADLNDYRGYAASKIASGSEIVLLAHLHQPIREEMTIAGKNGIYCNTGDFISHFSYVRIDNTTVELKNLD